MDDKLKQVHAGKVLKQIDFSLTYLKDLKKQLPAARGANRELAWGLAGAIAGMTTQIIDITNTVFLASLENNNPNNVPDFKQDLREIQRQFNLFMNSQINS